MLSTPLCHSIVADPPSPIAVRPDVDPALPSHAAIDKQGIQVGVIAQEIQEVLPDVVRQTSLGCYSVNPDNLTWYLVNAVKELSAENTALKARLDAAGL